jgi:hypothetical protein
VLPDDVFLEIFSLCVRTLSEWRTLVHVCQRWRQIIYASPRYLHLLLFCSNRTLVRKGLNIWPALPIAMSYHLRLPGDEDDVIALLKHSDRVRLIDLKIRSPQWGKVVAAMQEPCPVLTHLEPELSGFGDLPSGFLGGSAPHLQRVDLFRTLFPEFPTLLLSARDLVSLYLPRYPPDWLHFTGGDGCKSCRVDQARDSSDQFPSPDSSPRTKVGGVGILQCGLSFPLSPILNSEVVVSTWRTSWPKSTHPCRNGFESV